MLILQKGFNYSQDGPGNRLVYHVQGCNFHCKWCSNPESMRSTSAQAKNYSVDELADEANRSRMMFFDAGGVTFTGGECTLQHEELTELLKKLQELKINTAIETNASSIHLTQIAKYVDYLITDFKHYDDDEHIKWIGYPNNIVKENIEYFLNMGRQIHIRIPIIHGVNDNPDGFCEYFSSLPTQNAVFEFLPYHEFGKDKWTDKYEIQNGFISPKTEKLFAEKFIECGLKLIKT